MRLYPAPEHGPFVFGKSAKRALLLHGFPGTPWELRAVGRLLADLGYEAHAPLLPGFGPQISSLDRRCRYDWQASASAALASLLPGAEEVLLVGYSMGAALATTVAVSQAQASSRQPQRLVLINPFSGLGVPLATLLGLVTPFVPSYRPFVKADFDDPWVREVLGRMVPDLDIDDLAWRERVRREVCIPVVAVDQVCRLGAEAWRSAPAATVPTLVVQGREDNVVSPRRTRRFTRRLGGPVRLRETAGGHVVIWPGKPGHGELVGELTRFLRDPAASRTPTAAAVRRRSR
ncbi:MAG: alpha/beta fold hydrolase [Trueperaceae bacterium]